MQNIWVCFISNVEVDTVKSANRFSGSGKHLCFVAEWSLLKPVGRQSDWWGQLIVEGPAVKRDKYLLTRKLIFVLRHSKYLLLRTTNIYLRYYFRSVEVCNWQHEEMSWNGWEGVNEERHFYKFQVIHQTSSQLEAGEDEMCRDNCGFCHLGVRIEHLDSL